MFDLSEFLKPHAPPTIDGYMRNNLTGERFVVLAHDSNLLTSYPADHPHVWEAFANTYPDVWSGEELPVYYGP